MLDKAAGDVDRLTKSQERNVRQSQDVSRAARDLRKEYDDFSASVKRGEKSSDDAVFGLRRLSSEMDKLARKRAVGDQLGEDLNRASLAARRQIAEIEEINRVRQRATAQEIADRGKAMEQRFKERNAERDLRDEVKSTVRAFENFHSEVERGEHSVAGARTGYRQFSNEFASLQKRFKAGSDSAVNMGEKVEESRMHFDRLSGSTRRAGQEARKTEGFFQRLFNVDSDKLERIDQRLNEFERAANRSRFSVAAFDNRLRGLLVLGIFAFFQQLTSVVIGLGGALVSVASSAIQAGAALGGALVAGAAQAIPVIGLLISSFGRIGAVFKAVQQAQKQSMQAGYEHTQQMDKQANAAEAVRNAQEQLAAAHRSETDASTRVTDAQKALNKARFDAKRNLEDLIEAQRRSRLEEEAARQALEETTRSRKRAIAAGDIDQQVALDQQITSQRESVRSAQLASARATQDLNIGRRQGIAGNPGVVSASRSLDDARRSVKDAQRQIDSATRSLDKARRDAANTQKEITAADRTLQQMLAQLSPAERTLYTALRGLQATYKRLMRPITDTIVGGVTNAVHQIDRVLKNPQVLGMFRGLAGAIRGQMDRITKFSTSDTAVKFWADMGREAKRNLPIIGDISIAFFRLFRNIAEAAKGPLHDFLVFFRDLTVHAADATGTSSGMSKLERFFSRGEKYAENIVHLAGAFARLFGALMRDSAATGDSMIVSLTKGLNKATDWVNSHSKEVIQFFQDARSVADSLGRALWATVKALFGLFHPEQVKNLSDAFIKFFIPSISTAAKVMGTFTNLVLKFLGTGFGSNLAQLALTAALLAKAFSPLLTIGSRLIILLGTIFSSERLVAGGLTMLEVATGPIGAAFAVLVAAIALLNEKFHFLHPIVAAIKSVFDKFGDLVHHNPFAMMVGGVVSLTAAIKLLKLALGRTGLDGALGGLVGRLRGMKTSAKEAAGEEGKLAEQTRQANRAAQGTTTPGGIITPGRRGTREIDPETGRPVPGSAGEDLTRRQRLRRGFGRAARGIGFLALAGGVTSLLSQDSGDPYSHPNTGSRIRDIYNVGTLGIPAALGITPPGTAPSLASQANEARKRIDQLSSQGNIKKLQQVKDNLTSMRGTRPEYRQYLDQLIHRINLLKGSAPSVQRALKAITDPKFNTLGSIMMQARGALTGLPLPARLSGAEQIISSTRTLERQGRVIKGTTDNLIKGLVKRWGDLAPGLRQAGYQSMEALNNQFKNKRVLNTVKSAVDSAAKDFGGIPTAAKITFQNIPTVAEPALERLKKLTHSKNKDIRDQAKKDYRALNAAINDAQMKQLLDLRSHWQDMTAASKHGSTNMFRQVGGLFGNLGSTIGTVLDTIKDNVNVSLGSLGGKKLQFSIKKTASVLKDVFTGGAATGGFLGNKGERGPDGTGPIIGGKATGRGEAVLNWAHQKIVEPVLAAGKAFGFSPYGSLTDMFRGVRAQHAGGGGLAGGGFARGNIFDGHPSNVARGIRQLIEVMKRRFPLVVSSTTDHTLRTTTGGISDHSTGHAVDLSGATEVMFKAANWIKSSGLYHQLKQGIHNPNLAVNAGKFVSGPGFFQAAWPQHLNHIHLAIMGALGKFSAGAGGVPHYILRGGPAALRNLGQRAVDRVRNRAQRYIDAHSGSLDAQGTVPSFHGPWVQVMNKIADRLHWNLGDWRSLVSGESGGIVSRVNTSSGAFGLGQFLGATKTAYAKFGATSRRGEDQIRAMAQYIKDVYKNPTRAYHMWLSRSPHWYAQGGEIPGPLGAAREIVAHAKEWVLNERHQGKLARWLGTSRDKLKQALGFTGGPQSYQGGGEPVATGGARQPRIQGPRITHPGPYQEPTIHGIDVAGEIEQVNRAQRFLSSLVQRSKGFLGKYMKSLRDVIGDGGLLDQLKDAFDTLVGSLDASLKRATYTVTKSGIVIRRLSDAQAADLAVTNLEKEYKALMGERGVIQRSINDLNKRIANARRRRSSTHEHEINEIQKQIKKIQEGGVEKDERKKLEQLNKKIAAARRGRGQSTDEEARLIGARRNLQGRMRDVRSQIADNVEARYQAQEAAIQARIDAAQTTADRGTGAADRSSRIAAVLGITDISASTDARQKVLGAQVDSLNEAMKKAKSLGRTDLAQTIQDQISELQTQIVETAQQGLQSAVDQANNDAQKSQAGLDLLGRLADLREKAGDAVGAFGMRGSILGQQGANLALQQSRLQGLLVQAQQQGQLGIVDSLTQELSDLSVQIQENTAAITANTVQQRQAAIDAITGRGSFLGGVYDNLNALITAIGTNTGVIDIGAQRGLLGQSGQTLRETGSGLRQQLLAGYGIDVTGLSSPDLVQALSKLNYDGIEANFTTDQRQQFEALINSIIDNASQLEQNTTALDQLNQTQTQAWSSTAWQWFRNAIFTGSGGLLPQFQIPSMDVGGDILSDGVVHLHAGERVVAANVARGKGGVTEVFAPTIENHEKTVDMDTETVVNRLAFRYRTRPKAAG